MHSSVLLTTGEFAKLCNTTKNTLFHYDQIGLLKPNIIKNNGYRYYSIDQFSTFDLISVLRESGSSLKEIKAFMEHQNSENFIKILEEKKNILNKQKQYITELTNSINHIIKNTKKALHTSYFVPRLEHWNLGYIITTPFTSSPKDDKDYYDCLSKHIAYCQQHNISDDLSYGIIYDAQGVLQNEFKDLAYFSYLNKRKNIPFVKEQPAGMYLVIEHKGTYRSMSETYDIIRNYIKEYHLKVIGDFYEYDILNHLQTNKEEEYVIQISVQVEQQ
ncbi:DNA-binding transcriptional MerR regulator/effector-binding domain-containing protein [Breznakia sp. PF5-3]|uniref:MerR family transcriptional regulator n=1 Tax=unclassified Breznakia TaxID=2623764 RepID=UPI002405AEE9|nr:MULTISPECIES: MerR family transcriptional regulator [unclassified Breznakia]MDF9823687.1 DNA-binding transcriptional MerR regulator/effector-binding domain-containing protein [Breznakia sp. PM6-1]MDF9834485.1 DNA-binding transcriptional MerR regulator/effector-binding domain-containing protein [Breznakia sp. PF5-3]